MKTLKQLTKEKYGNLKAFDNHKFPQCRRDFIKLGMLAGAGALLPLSWPERLLAATMPSRIPFLTFDLLQKNLYDERFYTRRTTNRKTSVPKQKEKRQKQ